VSNGQTAIKRNPAVIRQPAVKWQPAVNRKFAVERQDTQRFWHVKQIFRCFCEIFLFSLWLFFFICRKSRVICLKNSLVY